VTFSIAAELLLEIPGRPCNDRRYISPDFLRR
jgi:hypothetical protein